LIQDDQANATLMRQLYTQMAADPTINFLVGPVNSDYSIMAKTITEPYRTSPRRTPAPDDKSCRKMFSLPQITYAHKISCRKITHRYISGNERVLSQRTVEFRCRYDSRTGEIEFKSPLDSNSSFLHILNFRIAFLIHQITPSRRSDLCSQFGSRCRRRDARQKCENNCFNLRQCISICRRCVSCPTTIVNGAGPYRIRNVRCSPNWTGVRTGLDRNHPGAIKRPRQPSFPRFRDFV
jgi:hypothetical protein